MKDIIKNLLKVKSIVTFVTCGVFIYVVVNGQIEEATITAILMLVFQNLFDRNKKVTTDTTNTTIETKESETNV